MSMPRTRTLASSLLLGLTLAACSTGSPASTSQVPIKFGATLALTGNLAYLSTDEQIGYDLALAKLNQQGGILDRPAEIIYEDNQGEAVKGVTTAKKLLEIDRVDFLFSAFTHISQAVEPLATEAKKTFIYAASTKTMAERSKYAFRDWADNVESGIRLAKLLKQRGEAKSAYAGVLDEVCNLTLGGLHSDGIKFLYEAKYQPETKDVSTEIIGMKNSGATAFVLCDWRNASQTMKTIKELGLIGTPTYHLWGHFNPISNTPEMQTLWRENKTIDIYYGPNASATHAAEKQRLEEAFIKRYGREPRPDVWFAYDRIFILKDAAEACGKIDHDCISVYLTNRTYDGISGKVRFDDKGVSWREVLVQQYGKDGWQELK